MFRYGIILLGFAGIILFFPFNFGNGHSCLAHQYFKSNSAGCCSQYLHQAQSEAGMETEADPAQHAHLLKHYLYPFAFLWWISIGIVALQIRNLKLKAKQFQSDKRV